MQSVSILKNPVNFINIVTFYYNLLKPGVNEEDLINSFSLARAEDKNLCYSVLFFARDPKKRGNKNAFHLILNHIRIKYNREWLKILPYVPKYGCWKDIFKFNPNNNLINFVIQNLDDPYCCKWFPRKGDWFKATRRVLNVSPKHLRDKIVQNSKTVEQLLCQNKWNKVQYGNVPFCAFKKYQNAFLKKDKVRFLKYIKSGNLTPIDIFKKMKDASEEQIDLFWQEMNYTPKMQILPVCDLSPSMKEFPYAVSAGVGTFLAEKMKGFFHNMYICAKMNPSIHLLEGTPFERLSNIIDEWGSDFSIYKICDYLLHLQKVNNISQDDMPEAICIISDIDFEKYHPSNELMSEMALKFIQNNQSVPLIILWNCRGKKNSPIKLISPNLIVMNGCDNDNFHLLLNVESFLSNIKTIMNLKDSYDLKIK